MNKFNKADISTYPAHLLKSYSAHAKYQLAEQSIKNHNYIALKHVLDNIDTSDTYRLQHIIQERLDVEAVKLIVARMSQSTYDYDKKGGWISDYIIKGFFKNEIEHTILDIKNVAEKKTEILKILLEAKDSIYITVQDLQKLADIVPKQEFDEFCQKKQLDLTTEQFKTLELSQYKFEGMDALVKLEGHGQTLVDLLLSRTFSDQLTVQQVKEIYSKLYVQSDLAKEMLTYTAALISQGNTIKIMFGGGTSSYYSPEQNIIKVDNIFVNEQIFNIESVLIHEIGHFIYDQINQNDALPFNFMPLKELFKKFVKQHVENIDDPYMEASVDFKLFSDKDKLEQFRQPMDEIIKPFLTYEEVARAPVDKAAELLLVDPKEYAKYLFTQEYTTYFKDHSYIDLFFLNAMAGFNTEKKIISEGAPDHVFDNILNMYIAEHDYCALENPFLQITREAVINWALEEFLPKLVAELNLSQQQIHFLSRIADYINRGEQLLDDSSSFDDNNEKYVELIVRAQELKAAGLDHELTDSFAGLEQFHIQYISPDICKVIQSSAVEAMPFDADMIGSSYLCVSSL